MPREQRKQGLRDDAEETRRTILRIAQDLFMHYGYRAVSTRQIADACGLTQPALYHYFTDKQALYTEVIKEAIKEAGAALERIARRNDSVSERLLRVIRYLLNTAQNDINLMLHDIQHELKPEARLLLNELFLSELVTPIASIFEDGLRLGLLRDQYHNGTDAITATRLLMSMLSHFTWRQPLSTYPIPSLSDTQTTENDPGAFIVHALLYGLAYPS